MKTSIIKHRESLLLYPIEILIALVIIIICCSFGRYQVSFFEVIKSLANYLFNAKFNVETNAYNSVIMMRLPRVLMAVLVGMALSVSGCVYQSTFNNSLVSPDLLGVSNGSCVGAAAVIMLGGAGEAIVGGAFLFGIIGVTLSLLLSSLMRNSSNICLVLSGIIVSALFSSMLGLIKYAVDSLEKLETITFWIMGSFSKITINDVFLIGTIIIISVIIIMLLRFRINIISLGKEEAESLGTNYKAIRIAIIILATLLTASSTSICGTISWIGLIVPHISRLFVGSNNKDLLPMSAFIGAIILPVIDTFCRTLTINEIPISIVSAAVGAFTYAIVLIKNGRMIHD